MILKNHDNAEIYTKKYTFNNDNFQGCHMLGMVIKWCELWVGRRVLRPSIFTQVDGTDVLQDTLTFALLFLLVIFLDSL